MRCADHERYRGLTAPKNGCPGCMRLHRRVRAIIEGRAALDAKGNPGRKFRRYPSLTTPSSGATLQELLAEISTLAIYGPQPRYFWKDDCAAAKHYKSMVQRFWSWKSRDPLLFHAFELLLFHAIIQFGRIRMADEVSSVESLTEMADEHEEFDSDPDASDIVGESTRRRRKGIGGIDA